MTRCLTRSPSRRELGRSQGQATVEDTVMMDVTYATIDGAPPPRLPRITDYVPHWAQRHPSRAALVSEADTWTYRDLSLNVDRCAASLMALGVRRGDRVAMLSDPRPEFFIVFLATASIGAIWVGLNPKHTAAELARTMENAGPSVLFCVLAEGDRGRTAKLAAISGGDSTQVVTFDEAVLGVSISYADFLNTPFDQLRAGLVAARHEVAALDPAAMIYTSGSTGSPKGALVPHWGLAHCGSIQAEHWYGQHTIKLCDLPINHIAALGDICCSVLTAGGTIVFRERFNPTETLRAIGRMHLTHIYAIPTQLMAMVESPAWQNADLSSLEMIIWGGASAPIGLIRELSRTGVPLATSYGLTESTGSMTYTDPGDPPVVLSSSVGRPDPRYELRLVPLSSSGDSIGEVGEVAIRGDHVTRGYFRDAKATRAAFDDDGWFHTGDIATADDQGRLVLVGRTTEMYKSGGYNIYPREIEVVLEHHPAVAVAAVVGIPDERWGEIGCVFIVPRSPTTAEELRRHCRTMLANYKVPKVWRFEESLPMLTIGKVDKDALRGFFR